jgi:epoxyqueuosine reductase
MSASSKQYWTKLIKSKAQAYGFSDCKIAKVEKLDKEAHLLEQWLKQGYHGQMSYMENHFELRIDPSKLVEGAKSVIVLQKNYFPSSEAQCNGFKISKYAYGEDYHKVIKKQMKALIAELQTEIGAFAQRSFVDSAPILEKAWAAKSGMSWQGKHSNALSPKTGSFYFLAEIVCDLELEYDTPIKDFCGKCTKCIDACPTEAIIAPYVVDSNKCISYLTIELKEQIDEQFKGKMDNWAFGCDVCHDVCPWNRFAKSHQEPAFELSEGVQFLQEMEAISELTEEVFESRFGKSAMKRTKYQGLSRNLSFISPSDTP